MTPSKFDGGSGSAAGAGGATDDDATSAPGGGGNSSLRPATTTSTAAAEQQPHIMLQPNSPSSSSSTSKNNGDSTFEPTVDMMVNDFDDEQTLEEEEELAAQEALDPSAELSSLQKESDMPLEELLALYNCYGRSEMDAATSSKSSAGAGGGSGHSGDDVGESDQNRSTSSKDASAGGGVEHKMKRSAGKKDTDTMSRSSSMKADADMDVDDDEEEEEDDDVEDEDDEDEDEEEEEESVKQGSHLRQLYPETYGASEKRQRTMSQQQSEDEDDGDYSPDEDELKKTIMVGSEFQAVIPEGFVKYDDALPYENEDKLLWDPSRLPESEAEEYLRAALHAKQESQQQNGNNHQMSGAVELLPTGCHMRDDEQALYLLQQCGHNTDEALRRQRMKAVPSSEQMSSWSEDECRNFESGIRIYGKDFHTIQSTKVRTRSVGELVQFYYLWKKSERHDIFANKARLEKKKYNLHPGLTDYMDRFLEEQDGTGSNGSTAGGAAGGGTGLFSTPTTSTATTIMTLRGRSLSPRLQHFGKGAMATVSCDNFDEAKRRYSGGTDEKDSECERDPLECDDTDPDNREHEMERAALIDTHRDAASTTITTTTPAMNMSTVATNRATLSPTTGLAGGGGGAVDPLATTNQ